MGLPQSVRCRLSTTPAAAANLGASTTAQGHTCAVPAVVSCCAGQPGPAPGPTLLVTVLVAASTRCVTSPMVTKGSLLSASRAMSSELLVYTSFHSPSSLLRAWAGGEEAGQAGGRGGVRGGWWPRARARVCSVTVMSCGWGRGLHSTLLCSTCSAGGMAQQATCASSSCCDMVHPLEQHAQGWPTSVGEGVGFCASSWLMSSLISARSSLLALSPRSVPYRESSRAAWGREQQRLAREGCWCIRSCGKAVTAFVLLSQTPW